MKIDIWSDYACPFCSIGKRKLEQALEKFPHRDQVEIEFKSFELDPSAPRDTDQSNHERLAAKYGVSVEQAKQMNEGMRQQAAEVGLTFNFDDVIPTNTFDAHRLTQFAKTKGQALELTEKLFRAYFTDAKHLGDHETLADIAEEAGIDRTQALSMLKDEAAYADEVRTDEALAQQMGIQGVPFFVINQKYAISGAQPSETFLQALERVWQEEHSGPVLQDLSGDNSQGGACTDGSCDIPKEK